MFEIGLSLGILYSENRTLGIKNYTVRESRDSEIRFLAGPARFRNLQTDLFCIKRDFIGPIKYTF